jgi:uncharacterized protein YjbK
MIEREKKMLISKEDYERLMERYGRANDSHLKPIAKQVNYYFDTDDFLMNSQNTTCRIRLKNDKYIATLKQHTKGSDLSTETNMKIFDGLTDNAFTAVGLKLQGELITYRCVIFRDDHCEVALDKNEYLGCEDYELEVEYDNMFAQDAERIIKEIAGLLNIETPSNTPLSKSTRFFEKKKHTGNKN